MRSLFRGTSFILSGAPLLSPTARMFMGVCGGDGASLMQRPAADTRAREMTRRKSLLLASRRRRPSTPHRPLTRNAGFRRAIYFLPHFPQHFPLTVPLAGSHLSVSGRHPIPQPSQLRSQLDWGEVFHPCNLLPSKARGNEPVSKKNERLPPYPASGYLFSRFYPLFLMPLRATEQSSL